MFLTPKPAWHKRGLYGIGLLLALLLGACNLQSASSVTPMPTPDLPRVEILAPPNNTRVIEDTEFVFDVVARDETQGISKIELSIDAVVVHEATPPDATAVPVFRVEMNWRARGIGKHFVEVVAYRPDGTRGDSAALTLEVTAP